MDKKPWVRITTDGPTGVARIVDAETGESLAHFVTHVSIDMPAGGLFVATLRVLAEVDIVAEAVIERQEVAVTAHDEASSDDAR